MYDYSWNNCETNRSVHIVKSKTKIRVLGVTFKENCSDIRSSQVLEIIKILIKNKIKVTFDDLKINPKILPKFFKKYYKKNINHKNDILILAVAHNEYKKIKQKEIKKILNKNKIIFDLKAILNKDFYISKNYTYWRL